MSNDTGTTHWRLTASDAVPIAMTSVGLVIAWLSAGQTWLIALLAACFGGSLAFLWDDIRLFRQMTDVDRRLRALEQRSGTNG